MSSTERVLPYQGHMIKIWEEYAMKEIRSVTKPTNILPNVLPIEGRHSGWRQWYT